MAQLIGLIVLVIFGVGYGVTVAHFPDFPHRHTSIKVVVGEAVTDAGMTAFLWIFTGNWMACLVPWTAHAIPGVLAWNAIGYPKLPARLTWLQVVLTDVVVDATTSLVLWLMTGNWMACLVPWLCHAATGVPMIGTQELKYYRDMDGAEIARKMIEERKR